MKCIAFLFVFFLGSNFCFAQEMTYYWAKLVESIEGSSSFEKRSNHEGSPMSLWLEIDSNLVGGDSINVRVHFTSVLNECESNYTLGTLYLHSRFQGDDRRRDVYVRDKFVTQVLSFPSTSPWMTIAKDGAVIITEIYDCGVKRVFGLFPIVL